MTDQPSQDKFAGLTRVTGFGQENANVTPGRTWVVMPYFDVEIRVTGDQDLAEIELAEFMDKALAIDETSPQAMTMARGFLRELVHPEDWEEFWSAVKRHRQGMEAQMAFARYVVEQITGHPTAAVSDSSPGPSNTATSSTVDYSLADRVQSRLESEGRPDLALAVVMAQEARAAGGS